MDSQAQGQTGERVARRWLEDRGYSCLATNWYCRLGEIDLIMSPPSADSSGEERVFVEVRVRSNSEYGSAVDSVSTDKQRKLIRAVRWYQQKEDFWGDVRFDVIALSAPDGAADDIVHIQGAFEVGLDDSTSFV